jgi:hypothetical protein
MEVNTDHPGMDYKRIELDEPDPELARMLCAKDPNCKAFTYVKPGVQGPKAICYLKSGVPPARSNPNCISGVKRIIHVALPIKEFEFYGPNLPILFEDLELHIDKRGSWFKIKPTGFDPITRSLDMGSFIKKGPAGIRKIKHNLQDINSDYWNITIRGGKLRLFIRFETGGPIEVKRYAKGALGRWRDGFAYDINLRRFEFTVSFAVGGERIIQLTPQNIINNIDVDRIILDAEISNVPDWMEVWGIVDREISKELKREIIKVFSDGNLKTNLYNALMRIFKENLGEVEIVSAYCSGEYLIVRYRTR